MHETHYLHCVLKTHVSVALEPETVV